MSFIVAAFMVHTWSTHQFVWFHWLYNLFLDVINNGLIKQKIFRSAWRLVQHVPYGYTNVGWNKRACNFQWYTKCLWREIWGAQNVYDTVTALLMGRAEKVRLMLVDLNGRSVSDQTLLITEGIQREAVQMNQCKRACIFLKWVPPRRCRRLRFWNDKHSKGQII